MARVAEQVGASTMALYRYVANKDELPADDPRAGHLGVYHWLTYVQDGLVQSRMAVR